MLNFSLKKTILSLIIGFIFISFFLFDINEFFTLDAIIKNNNLLLEYVQKNKYFSILLLYSIFLILLIFFIHIASIMVILSSYLFGLFITIPISILVVTIGGLLNFFLLKKINLIKIFEKANSYALKLQNKIKKNEFQYILILRLIPMPFIIQNAVMVILNVRLQNFLIATMIGVTPYAIIYSLAGYKLKELIYSNDTIGLKDIINYENFLIIAIFVTFIFISIILKKKIN